MKQSTIEDGINSLLKQFVKPVAKMIADVLGEDEPTPTPDKEPTYPDEAYDAPKGYVRRVKPEWIGAQWFTGVIHRTRAADSGTVLLVEIMPTSQPGDKLVPGNKVIVTIQ